MELVYYSRTGNTKRFIDKLQSNIKKVSIDEYSSNEPFILLTPTYNFGQIPNEVSDFLLLNKQNIKGVISTGNMNWGDFYANAGRLIAKEYNTRWLYKLELSGNKEDVKEVDNILDSML